MIRIEKITIHGFSIEVHYKKMKNVYLRIKPDGKMILSVPIKTKRDYIDKFITERQEWIVSKQNTLTQRQKSALQLGENETLIFGTPVIGAFSEHQLQALLHEKITQYLTQYFSFFAENGLKQPQIKYRMMRSTWGVCRPTLGTITFNRRLIHQPLEFIEYVVVHELCHLIVPNHSRDFYNLVGHLLPNHRKAEKMSILLSNHD